MRFIILSFLIPLFLFAGPGERFKKEKKEDATFIGSDIVGWSYNIFDKYASNESKKKPLFKFPEKTKLVLLENITKHDIRVVSGSNSHEYFSSVNTRLGLEYNNPLSTFGGSLEASFGKESLTQKSTSFVTIQDYTWKWRISLNIANEERDIPRLKSYIISDALADINTMKPEDLFNSYGTHFIARAYIGGRADYNASVENSSKWTKTDIEANIKAQFKVINTSVNTNIQKTNKEISDNTKTKLTITGGNAEFMSNINNEEQYKTWAEGIKDSPVLCDFEMGSLIPIWVLADSPERSKELEDYFKNTYILKYPLPKLIDKLNERPTWEPTKQRCFFIKNKKSGKYIDLAGVGFLAKTTNGTDISLWDNDNFSDRVICFNDSNKEKGYYNIKTRLSSKVFDIRGDWDKNAVSNKYQNGAKVQLWENFDNAAQQFQFEIVDKSNAGYIAVFIRSKVSGLYIQPKGKGDNGDELVQMPFTGADNQIWHLELANPDKAILKEMTDFTFVLENRAHNKVMDISGKGRTVKNIIKRTESNCNNGENVGLYSIDGGNDQHVKIVPAGDNAYYLEFQHCGQKKRLDVSGDWNKKAKDSKYKDGRNIQLWEHNGNDAQKFYLQKISANEFMIVNKATGLAVKSNGNNTFQGGKPNPRESAMIWRFIEIGSKKALEFE
ncbi:RICIN domain-containing protein [bacterium]|nr:RICIN domain-containing protein [bacterium]